MYWMIDLLYFFINRPLKPHGVYIYIYMCLNNGTGGNHPDIVYL
jgi:hypothetical protein